MDEINNLKNQIEVLEKKIKELESDKESALLTFNEAPDAIFIAEIESGIIIDCNEKAQKLIKKEKNEIVGLHQKDLHPQDIRDEMIGSFDVSKDKSIDSNSYIPLESILEDSNGNRIPVEIQASIINYKGKQVLHGIFRDISKRKEYQNLYELLANHISDAITVHDLEGNFRYISPAMKNNSGWEPKDWENRSFMDIVHPDDRQKVIEATVLLAKGEKDQSLLQWRCLTADGEYLWMETVTNRVYNKDKAEYLLVASSRNITKQKNYDLKIEENEIKFRTLFENAGDAIFLMDKEIFIDCNEKTLKMFDCERKDIIGKPPYMFSPKSQPDGKDSKEQALIRINKAIDDKPQYFEWVHKKKSGELFDAEVSLNRIDLHGKTYIQAIVRDISDKKYAERALEVSKDNYKKLVENSPVPILIHSNYIIKFVNKAALNLAEAKKPSDMIGKNINEFIHKRSQSIVEQRIKNIYYKRKDQQYQIENLITLSGKELICEVAAIYFEFKNEPSSLVVFRDMTSEFLTDEAIKENERLMRNALDSVKDGIWEFDIDSGKLFLSDHVYSLFEYNKGELTEDIQTWLDIFSLIDIEKKLSTIKQHVGNLNDSFEFEIPFTTKSGKSKWVLLRGKYYENQIHELKRKFIGMISDVSKFKEQEDILNYHRKELEKALKEKENFLSLIGHDLKSPVAGLKGLAKYIIDDFEKISKKELKEIILSFYNSAENVFVLLENLLKWSKISGGLIESNITKLNLKEQVEKNINLLNQFAMQKSISINHSVNEDIFIEADQEFLATILRNILSNAIKFSDKNKDVNIRSQQFEKNIDLIIEDNGVGIETDKLEKIFKIDQYETTDGTDGEKGSGLGLIIIKELIEKMGGKIDIQSTKNVGTTVKLTFIL